MSLNENTLEDTVKDHKERIQNLEESVDRNEKRIIEQNKRLTLHEERLEKASVRLDLDKEDISMLKARDREKHERLLLVEENYRNLEKIMTKESKETREVMRSQTDKLYEIVHDSMNHNANRHKQNHELKMAKMNTWSTVFLKVSGGVVGLLTSGGLIYFIVERLFEM